MTEAETPFVFNVVLDNGDQGREYRNGRGKVVRVGDMIRVDSKSAKYRVLDLRVEGGQVYVTAYGGPKGRLLTRTFHVDRCSRALKGEDNNEDYRAALHETSSASKSKRRGWQ